MAHLPVATLNRPEFIITNETLECVNLSSRTGGCTVWLHIFKDWPLSEQNRCSGELSLRVDL